MLPTRIKRKNANETDFLFKTKKNTLQLEKTQEIKWSYIQKLQEQRKSKELQDQ